MCVCDFLNLECIFSRYKDNYFDVVLSISALQWPIANKEGIELKNIVKQIGKHILKLLSLNGVCVIQFYPASDSVFEDVCSAFERVGFKVEEFLYNEQSIRKKKYFIVLRRE